ncbi:nucleotide-sugar transporter-domain-containing protein [Obelidium mucronatum]|nr:nucleotide-sugar transporter-domain-containing protein [Obelidium mucronatum]
MDSREAHLFGIPLKYLSLVTLVVQNSMLVIIMKFSRNNLPGQDMYVKSTAVLASEIVKLCICVFVYTRENTSFHLMTMLNDLFGPESESWKMLVPAVVYVIQNNLQYLAVENLDPATFQVSYQLKILTTAIFSVIMLKKSLSRLKWASLFILTFGVALVQLQPDSIGESGQKSVSESAVGLIAVAIACVLSGIAGVWFEKVLKGSKTSLWQKNIQLSFFSLFPAIFTVFVMDGPAVMNKGFFYGYNGWTFGAIACQALGGLLVSLVVKYADNILKGFATSLSIILSAVASMVLFDFELSTSFVVGCGFVLYATHLYGMQDAPRPADYAKLRAEDTQPIK